MPRPENSCFPEPDLSLVEAPPELYRQARTTLGLQQVDAMTDAGDELDPAVRQTVGEGLLLRRSDRAVVAAQQQNRRGDPRQQGNGIDLLEAIVHGRGDLGRRPVHLAYDP